MKLIVNQDSANVYETVVYNIRTEEQCISFIKESNAINGDRFMRYFKEYGAYSCFRLVYEDSDVRAFVGSLEFYQDNHCKIIEYKMPQRSE